jgi:glycine/D-amino acid oxidase-like deaminating enzyme
VSRPDIAIIGGGLLGRTLAWRAALQGFRVELFDAGDRDGRASAAWVAGGMIAPLSEAAEAPTALVEMGMRSLALWPAWISELSPGHHFVVGATAIEGVTPRRFPFAGPWSCFPGLTPWYRNSARLASLN